MANASDMIVMFRVPMIPLVGAAYAVAVTKAIDQCLLRSGASVVLVQQWKPEPVTLEHLPWLLFDPENATLTESDVPRAIEAAVDAAVQRASQRIYEHVAQASRVAGVAIPLDFSLIPVENVAEELRKLRTRGVSVAQLREWGHRTKNEQFRTLLAEVTSSPAMRRQAEPDRA